MMTVHLKSLLSKLEVDLACVRQPRQATQSLKWKDYFIKSHLAR